MTFCKLYKYWNKKYPIYVTNQLSSLNVQFLWRHFWKPQKIVSWCSSHPILFIELFTSYKEKCLEIFTQTSFEISRSIIQIRIHSISFPQLFCAILSFFPTLKAKVTMFLLKKLHHHCVCKGKVRKNFRKHDRTTVELTSCWREMMRVTGHQVSLTLFSMYFQKALWRLPMFFFLQMYHFQLPFWDLFV